MLMPEKTRVLAIIKNNLGLEIRDEPISNLRNQPLKLTDSVSVYSSTSVVLFIHTRYHKTLNKEPLGQDEQNQGHH